MNTLTLPWRFFQSLSVSGRIGLLITLFWIVMAVFGTALAPHNLEDIGGGPLFILKYTKWIFYSSICKLK